MQRDFSIKFCLSSIPSGALLSHMLKKIKVIDSATLMCCGVDLFSLKPGLWLKLRAQAPAPVPVPQNTFGTTGSGSATLNKVQE